MILSNYRDLIFEVNIWTQDLLGIFKKLPFKKIIVRQIWKIVMGSVFGKNYGYLRKAIHLIEHKSVNLFICNFF